MAIAPVGYYSWTGKGAHGFIAGTRDNAGIEVIGVKEVLQRFNALSTDDRDMNKQIKKIISYVIKEARKKTSNTFKSNLDNDPRKAYMAIKSLVYKRLFGGNISLLNKRKRSAYRASLPPTKPQSGRGGNRRKRSSRTENVMSYWGADRGFVLRFLNQGTTMHRRIWTSNNWKVDKAVGRGYKSITMENRRNGNRGGISGSNWFDGASHDAMDDVSHMLLESIEEAIQLHWKEKTNVNLNYNMFE